MRWQKAFCRVCRTRFWMSELIFCRALPDLGIFWKVRGGLFSEQIKIVGFGFPRKTSKSQKLYFQNWKLISKSVSLIPLESDFGTMKSEFSAPNYPNIFISVSKFNCFSFDQNLDFALGRRACHMAPRESRAMGGQRSRPSSRNMSIMRIRLLVAI